MKTREESILQLLNKEIKKDDLVIASTGRISRELFELRVKRKEPTTDFLMLGSMGCAVGIGLGVALNTKKKVYVLTGDGALLMKFGSIATVFKYKLKNLKIIVLNNYCHDSCGGQATAFEEIRNFIPCNIKIMNIKKGTRKNLGRPTITPIQNKKVFMEKIKNIVE